MLCVQAMQKQAEGWTTRLPYACEIVGKRLHTGVGMVGALAASTHAPCWSITRYPCRWQAKGSPCLDPKPVSYTIWFACPSSALPCWACCLSRPSPPARVQVQLLLATAELPEVVPSRNQHQCCLMFTLTLISLQGMLASPRQAEPLRACAGAAPAGHGRAA